MSLVNEALRKARLEAARQEIARERAALPSLGRPLPAAARRSLSPRALLLLALVATAALAFMTVRWFRPAGKESGPVARTASVPVVDPTDSILAVAEKESPSSILPTEPGSSNPAAEIERRDSSASELRKTRVAPETGSSTRPAAKPLPAAVDSGNNENRIGPEEGASIAEQRPETPPTAAPLPFRGPTELRAEATSASSTEPSPSSPATLAEEEIVAVGSEAESIGNPPATELQGEETAEALPQPETKSYLREAELPGIGTFRLDGIAWSTDRPFALINGQVVGPGGFVDGVSVAEVTQDRIVLTRDDLRFELRLR
jgi:hypothetical protein